MWSIADFEKNRPELCDFLKEGVIKDIEKGERFLLIRAPVKSGKRQIVEYLALRDHPTRKHIFLTQWHRTADEGQRQELESYGIKVYSGLKTQKVEKYSKEIQCLLDNPHVKLIINIDECDYGSGHRQAMAQIWKRWHDQLRITFILYSATPEEVMFSTEKKSYQHEGDEDSEHQGDKDSEDEKIIWEIIKKYKCHNYTPPLTFCGPAEFLEKDLVFEALPFFERVECTYTFQLSEQGKKIIKDFEKECIENPSRNILLLRLTYSDGSEKSKKGNKAIYQFLQTEFAELKDKTVIVDKDEDDMPKDIGSHVVVEKIQWSSSKWWETKATGKPLIIVLDQTFSRSTEFAAHDRVFALHDYRKQNTYNTIAQATQRMNHYSTRYQSGFQPIKIYCHRSTYELAAGKISYNQYILTIPEASSKPTQSRAEQEGSRKRQRTKLSSRTNSTSNSKNRLKFVFVECSTTEEYNERCEGEGDSPFENNEYKPNPEDKDQRYKCCIRGVYKPRTVDEIIKESYGINETTRKRSYICYDSEGNCGVLFVEYDGRENLTTIKTAGSMYNNN